MKLKLAILSAIFCIIVFSSQLHAQAADGVCQDSVYGGCVFIFYQSGNNDVYMAYGDIGDGNPNDQDQYDSTWVKNIPTGISVADDGISTTVFDLDTATPKLMLGAKVKNTDNKTVVQTQVLQTVANGGSTWNSQAVLIDSNRKFGVQNVPEIYGNDKVYGSFMKNGKLKTKKFKASGQWVDAGLNTDLSNASGEILAQSLFLGLPGSLVAAVLKSSSNKGIKFRVVDPPDPNDPWNYKKNWNVNKNRGVSLVTYPGTPSSIVAYTNSSNSGLVRYSNFNHDGALYPGEWSDSVTIGVSLEGYPVLTAYNDSIILLAYTNGSNIYLLRGLQISDTPPDYEWSLLRQINTVAKYLSIVQYDATNLNLTP